MLRRVLSIALVTLVTLSEPAAFARSDDSVAGSSRDPGETSRSAPMQDDRPAYTSEISPIPWRIRRWMTGVSWRAGCPVPIRRLRLIRLRYWGFDREAHMGRLVVHRHVARKVAAAFGRLYEVSFPIRQMRLVDYYGANDRTSMRNDNTSAFNCRWRAGQPGVWSMHAYGKAIDINPVENPFVTSGGYSPPNAGAFVDRSDRRRGMIYRGDAVWWAFRNRGWEWGGDWRYPDYQHFSTNGR